MNSQERRKLIAAICSGAPKLMLQALQNPYGIPLVTQVEVITAISGEQRVLRVFNVPKSQS